jgi:K+-sensing histidine kinase KdpD
MCEASADVVAGETTVIHTARRTLRWARWAWLAAALIVYIGWSVIDQNPLLSFDSTPGGFDVDWLIVALLGLILTLLIGRAQDRQLARLEAQIARTIAAERTVLRLEAEQAQARAEALAESARLKSTLLAAASHDFRTPLEAITAAADELLAEDVYWNAEAMHDFAAVIRTEARRLAHLGNNFLDLTRIEAGVLHLQRGWYHIAEIVNRVLDRCAPDLADRPLELDVPETLPLLPVDYIQIEQVLWNLVQNAVKYSPPGSPLGITASLQDALLCVSIADRGPGIPPGERARVFEPFYRPDADRNARVVGTGIGLAICKGLVEAHGGQITIHGRDGGGTLVRIDLPLRSDAVEMNQGVHHGLDTYSDHR